MRTLPALDLHAHIEPAIAAHELTALDAAVFAVTRSLDEAEVALRRNDPTTVWGVGCHPGLVGAQRDFSIKQFADLLDATPFVGEVGLDGQSRVPMVTQVTTFRSVLETLRDKPRIATIHSYSATGKVLDLLAEVRRLGIVLHWWLGSPTETAHAVDLGCYFSVNAAMLKRDDILRSIPLDRLLTETDHPFGDRRSHSVRRPGAVGDVEMALATMHGLSKEMIRIQLWRNLRRVVTEWP
jgi:TatD DNase family protein